ncbi:uncharacterized protein BX663DRAFT_519591 [Cokeromyces recurvatus]|uniref:uncharacterized protein n=1 Tax=Cokeromyces recurvatus TaxID=90255 RepID=UPI00222015A2|nr:uncharacterized protein BX663DRAFT_519591 [Cokeromyces recurvatus]KAI7899811.1 hypothetical protein BX663DRAFT_519591 [Cokeromyces recurvatus]
MMLLINRFKIPLLKKSSRVAKNKPIKRLRRRNSNKSLPYEIQELVCHFLLEDDPTNSIALICMRVCKSWARFICERLYREFQFKNYIQFIGFVNTISLHDPLFPYGSYVRNLDLTPVNKYGVDMRVRRLIKHCPNMVRIRLGPTTSVKAETLQLMGRYCHHVHTLEMGGLQSFPFMFDCDFSGMLALKRLSLITTPLQANSLETIPNSIRHLQITQLDALYHDEFIQFLKHHPRLVSLSIHRCRHLNTADLSAFIPCLPHLSVLELTGPEIGDDNVKGLFKIPIQLHTLKLSHTQISDQTLESLAFGSLTIQHLDISHNVNLTLQGLQFLLKRKKFKQLMTNLI